MVALVPFDWQAHDSYFIVAHLHYVLIGGMLFPIFAGIYYYYPLIGAGRCRQGRSSVFWLMFTGFNIAFFPCTWPDCGECRAGSIPTADLGWDWLNLISGLGAVVLGIGMFAVVVDVTLHRRKVGGMTIRGMRHAGAVRSRGKWGMRSVPRIQSRYPLWEQEGLAEEVNAGDCIWPTPARAGAHPSPRCWMRSRNMSCASKALRWSPFSAP